MALPWQYHGTFNGIAMAAPWNMPWHCHGLAMATWQCNDLWNSRGTSCEPESLSHFVFCFLTFFRLRFFNNLIFRLALNSIVQYVSLCMPYLKGILAHRNYSARLQLYNDGSAEALSNLSALQGTGGFTQVIFNCRVSSNFHTTFFLFA
jgi:hypothetical protein